MSFRYRPQRNKLGILIRRHVPARLLHPNPLFKHWARMVDKILWAGSQSRRRSLASLRGHGSCQDPNGRDFFTRWKCIALLRMTFCRFTYVSDASAKWQKGSATLRSRSIAGKPEHRHLPAIHDKVAGGASRQGRNEVSPALKCRDSAIERNHPAASPIGTTDPESAEKDRVAKYPHGTSFFSRPSGSRPVFIVA